MDSAEGIARFWVDENLSTVERVLESLCTKGFLARRQIAGARFYSLPKDGGLSRPVATDTGAEVAGPGTDARARILVADDDPAIRKLLVDILSGAGHSVTAAEEGLQATQMALAGRFDLVVTDVVMPGMSGIEVLQEVKRLNPTTEVLVVTGHADLRIALQALRHGAYDLVTKPIDDLDTLLRGVARALERQRFAHENRLLVESLQARNRELRETLARLAAADEADTGGAALRNPGATAGSPPAEGTLQAKADQLEAITGAVAAFLEQGDWREASVRLVRAALDQTRSEYGFSGVVVEGPVLRILAHDGIVWDTKTNREFYEEALRTYHERGYLEFTNLNNLFGAVITSGKTVLSNDPAADTRSGDLPPGHPPLQHFLGVPMLHGGEVVGMLAVANRPGGYGQAEQRGLEVLSGLAGVLYDSYRRQDRERSLEQQLRKSQKMEAVGRLAGGIAHDFNNLLTVIMGYCDLFNRPLAEGKDRKKVVREIREAGERATSLTKQLLAFSRQQVLTPRVLDLNTVMAGLIPMLRRLIGEHIDVSTVLIPELGRVKTDPSQMEQVIVNLAVNARDAMPHGGSLTLETANVTLDEVYARRHIAVRPGPYVMLAVSDTGSGMDKETQAKIFEPFFTTKAQGKGTGLGLATVYGIVKQSGGNIWVYSEPGHGTTFKVYLPRVDEAVETERPPCPISQSPRGSETVLLVEDDEAVRELACQILRANGYAVLEAPHGHAALEICEKHEREIHLLFTDVVMPRMSGRDLAARARSLRPALRVLYTSGYTGDAIAHHGVLDVGVPYLQKPFSTESLTCKVREVLDAPQPQKR